MKYGIYDLEYVEIEEEAGGYTVRYANFATKQSSLRVGSVVREGQLLGQVYSAEETDNGMQLLLMCRKLLMKISGGSPLDFLNICTTKIHKTKAASFGSSLRLIQLDSPIQLVEIAEFSLAVPGVFMRVSAP